MPENVARRFQLASRIYAFLTWRGLEVSRYEKKSTRFAG